MGRLARQRDARETEGVFVVEGPKLLGEALAAGAVIEEVFVADDAELPPDAVALLDRAEAAGASIAAFDGARFRKVLDAVSPQPLAAVVARPVVEPTAVLGGASLVVVLAGVADPGNAGTLVRSAVAAGADAVVCTEGTVEVWSPKCVRSSGGLVLRVPVLDGLPVEEACGLLRGHGLRTLGTSVTSGPAYDAADLCAPVAFVLGNEARGLPAEVGELLDGWVTIPMAGAAESLNVAMAGTVLCFEARRQRRTVARGAGAAGTATE